MRILHILDHSIPLHSGYTFRTQAILEQQRRMGWETFHVTGPKHGMAAGFQDAEETVDGLHFYRSGRPNWLSARIPVLNQYAVIRSLEKRLEQVVDEVRPDVLHAHSPALNGVAALRVGRRRGIPVVYEIRAFWEDAAVDHGTSRPGGPRYRLSRLLETSVVRHADAVTTICEGLRNELVERGIAPEKITVIPNAVDIARFGVSTVKDPELLRALGLDGQMVLGFLGSFYAYEGLALLLRALPAIVSAHPNTKLLLVGGGPQEGRLRSLAGELGVEAQVIFAGRVPHQEVHRYYTVVDLLVYPRVSIRLTELVTPLKPLEAMAQGKLVVASDVGGHRELIVPSQTGALFKAGDARALAQKVNEMLGMRDQWHGLQARARAYVERERTWQVSVEGYRSVYSQMVEVRAAQAPHHGGG